MQVGENGCLEYGDAAVGSDVLAISQLVRGGDATALAKGVLRRRSTQEIVQLFVLNFVIRNARGGKGEKKLAYDLFLTLAGEYPETTKALLPCFVHYGYWKDLLMIIDLARGEGGDEAKKHEGLIDEALRLMKHQWDKDVAALSAYKKELGTAESADDQPLVEKIKKQGPQISLLSKWLPREGRALDKKTDFVDRFAALVSPAAGAGGEENSSWESSAKRDYRRLLAELTAFLKLPEVLLAAHRADEIEIQRVASKATKNLTRAFLNERKSGELRSDDAKRSKLRDMFLDSIVEKGLKGGQVMPHEIVKTIMDNRSLSTGMKMSLQAQWKSIWAGVVEQVKAKAKEEGLEFDPTQMVPISDVSGSMSGTPMEVAIALGIGISEITHPAFRDTVMTFSADPEWFRFDANDTIVEKVRKLQGAPWGMNTNFSKAYDLILEICERNKLKREEMPCLIVFSDMQFDEACCSGYYSYGDSLPSKQTMFEHIRSRVEQVAKKLGWKDSEPSPIVFWNLRNTCGHPVDKDTEGTVLLSGFSPSLLKLVMNGEALKEEEMEVVQADGTVVKEKARVTPEEILKKMLGDSQYDPVRKILGSSREGALQSYEYIQEFDENMELV